jgi:GPH family glycoside/pentoside/hexuronide:cation symporter
MTALYFAIVLFGIGALGSAAGAFLGPSIQADVIDYDELYTGKRREAQYAALWLTVVKFVVIPSSSIPLAVLGVVGFQPNVEQTELVRWTILILFSLVPAVITLAAMVLALRFPINEQNHRRILLGIERHKQGEPATDPLTGRRVDPPDNRGLDEETGWYLDHFSAGELRRFIVQGPGRLLRDAATALGISGVVCLLSIAYVAVSLGDLSTPPDLYAVLGILIAGVSLTAVCFHGVRLRATRNADTIRIEDVRIHLDIAQRLSQRKVTSGSAAN